MDVSPSSDHAPGRHRKSEGAFAVITRQRGGVWEWLTRWNRKWGCYFLIGGHKHEDETFAACVARELEEELGVREGVDYTLNEEPLSCQRYVAWSISAGAETEYTMVLFALTPQGVGLPAAVQGPALVARGVLASEESLCWVTEEDIRRARTGDGEPISERMASLFESAGWPHGGGDGAVQPTGC